MGAVVSVQGSLNLLGGLDGDGFSCRNGLDSLVSRYTFERRTDGWWQKNASLGEMYRALAPRGIRIPYGFATTADAYRLFLRESGLDEKIEGL